MKILFLATYFPRPLNPTIGTWALEQAKAFQRASEEAQLRVAGSKLRVTSGEAGGAPATSSPPPVTTFRVISGNPWFPKIAGKLKSGIRVYSECPRSHSWDGVEVDYLPMLFYPFGKLDAIFNRVGEPMLRLGWWSIKWRLMKVVEEFQPDVVYAHHTVPNGYFALRIHRQTGIPFVVTDHETGEISACEVLPARRAVYEKVIRAASRMVSVSESMSREMLRVLPESKTIVIHNGVNLARAPEALKLEALDSRPSPPLVILSCGMFYERKNFPGLIQAFNLVAEKYPNVTLRILGDGPDRIKVKQARNASPFKDRIELPGKVSHAEVLQQMQEADIFALIGWNEPFGVVFLEAMAAGLPMIASSDAGVAEVIHSVDLSRASSVERRVHTEESQMSYAAEDAKALESGAPAASRSQTVTAPEAPALNSGRSTLDPTQPNGLLVPPRDIAAAARALEFLILNPEARKQIGIAAKRKIDLDLNWDAATSKYLQVFRNACLK